MMLTLITKWLVSAVAIFGVGYVLPGIVVPSFSVALVCALVLGILSVTLGSVLKLLTFPITVLTLGLSALLLNGFVFWLAARFVEGMVVTSYWSAFLGALGVSVVSAILNRIFLGSDGKWGGQ